MSSPAIAEAIAAGATTSRIVVFSGAGASADSGIGTFRGVGGTWTGFFGNLALLWGGTPLGWRYTPSLVWRRFVSDFHDPIAAAKPHAGYDALVRLEKAMPRMAFRTITMNVDGLHQTAGASHVAEVHGSVRRFRCMACGEQMDHAEPLDGKRQPRCGSCGGRCRPDVTLFTEALPLDQWMKAEDYVSDLQRGDMLVVVGTSSVVYPAASLPEVAKQRGATIVEFNLEVPTPLSSLADITVVGRAAETLPSFVDGLLAARQQGM